MLVAALLFLSGVGCLLPREGPVGSPARITTEAEWIDLEGLERHLAGEKGRIVVVNFWATWCEPCREEFPELIRLHQHYASRGLTLLSISLDSPRVRDTLVKNFLAEQKPPFPAFIKTGGDDDAFINALDPDWSGALPATFIYDRQGRRRQALFGEQTFQSLEGYIQPLL
jgi:thiol-disulfide isomerase/thioredoxin